MSLLDIQQDNYDTPQLTESLSKNICNRNQTLNSIMTIMNNLQGGNIIGLDGAWGAGKTFTIKQLEMLWKRENNETHYAKIDPTEMETFQNTIIPLYYNAWDNDYATDPCQSLLLTLAESLQENENIIKKAQRQLVNSLDIDGFKNDLLSKYHYKPDYADYGKNIYTATSEVNKNIKLQKLISESIDKKLHLQNNCKLLFIIDDLDRCKPSFAINLLESIKTCFNNKKIIFLVATNFSELGNIVRGYYGGYIDGYNYLDRIFNLKITLTGVNYENYFRYKAPELQSYTAEKTATSLHFSMREVNHFATIMQLCDSYFDNYHLLFKNQHYLSICKNIFAPIFIAYQIKNYNNYNKLINCEGFDCITSLLSKDQELKQCVYNITDLIKTDINATNLSSEEILKQQYDKLFSKQNYDDYMVTQKFWDFISLTGIAIDKQ